MNEYTLFYKNHVYKNVKAQISKKNKNRLRTYLRLLYNGELETCVSMETPVKDDCRLLGLSLG